MQQPGVGAGDGDFEAGRFEIKFVEAGSRRRGLTAE